jgi:hypothetical protein
MGQRLGLAAALAFVVVLLGLTIYAAVADGPSVLTVVSLVVLAMLGLGIAGALRHPPEP